jgi:hypothetical protein
MSDEIMNDAPVVEGDEVASEEEKEEETTEGETVAE